MKYALFLIMLVGFFVGGCGDPLETEASNGLSIEGTIVDIPARGLPEGTRGFVIWETHIRELGAVMRVGQQLDIDQATGRYSLKLEGNLSEQFVYAPGPVDTLAVGNIILTTSSTMSTGMTANDIVEWESEVIGALDNHAIVYKRGDPDVETFKDFRQGFSIGVTIPKKPVERDGVRPVDAPLKGIEIRKDYYFPDWH
jgi:hypothetical protein